MKYEEKCKVGTVMSDQMKGAPYKFTINKDQSLKELYKLLLRLGYSFYNIPLEWSYDAVYKIT